ncbi:MAG: hypothetical protein COX77_01255 [Candidatus Komeilibacteria bacterium CG_4_10_14_0_2_um_filter_37_10]|uniref:dTDP-4-dehydrorhamnose reductase n=1 Tax=Candidatus Komeilibacteria bacterium CG_4_10_14_0_2_um_filter_37_10 TaxID=1974470 RepID=A0A2M7VGC5_9BACT|nr:MAG: hypothetical protein COX77_01255 [Candidatus Komeilibacteria bacterium CG_4_10_14_0_2_um_filter_37_10]PJA94177.1 MAG: hypothetical protein CO133_00365 [Candidatus Komeilibacteria bacterium CG_4_9_14_3_um_filter_37_5]
MKLIIGNGYLGEKFKNYIGDSVVSSVFINSEQDVVKEIDHYRPNWVINCAGITGRPNIDWCEDHREETFVGNILLPLQIAKACQSRRVRMLHLGSGCVYQGDNCGRGFSEDDAPNFGGSFYSLTKALSEQLLRDFNVLQLRLRMPIDSDLNSPRNFVKKITHYEKVIDIQNSMTIVEDLLLVAEDLMKKERSGIYNVVNPGPLSHHQILDLYQQIVDPDFKYQIITIEELGKITRAGRSNCVLNGEKLAKEIELPVLKERLIKLFTDFVKNK